MLHIIICFKILHQIVLPTQSNIYQIPGVKPKHWTYTWPACDRAKTDPRRKTASIKISSIIDGGLMCVLHSTRRKTVLRGRFFGGRFFP